MSILYLPSVLSVYPDFLREPSPEYSLIGSILLGPISGLLTFPLTFIGNSIGFQTIGKFKQFAFEATLIVKG